MSFAKIITHTQKYIGTWFMKCWSYPVSVCQVWEFGQIFKHIETKTNQVRISPWTAKPARLLIKHFSTMLALIFYGNLFLFEYLSNQKWSVCSSSFSFHLSKLCKLIFGNFKIIFLKICFFSENDLHKFSQTLNESSEQWQKVSSRNINKIISIFNSIETMHKIYCL